ncbi:MAG: citrate synthase/methylcitrate synthase [Thaumarchaeota archaeon]|nr:citrate synthase/methylcitrate synthase [Nitrososphaerota archaeon]
MVVVNKGLDNIYVKESKICFIDGENSKLYYRGFSIEELAEKSNFEEVAYLLIHGQLPTREQLSSFNSFLAENRGIEEIMNLMRLIPKTSHPVDMLRTAVSALGMHDSEASDNSRDATVRKALRVLAKAPTIVAAFDRLRKGKEPVKPDARLSHAANFLYMLSGKKPTEREAKILDIMLILHAEHEMNASSFSCSVTVSTLSDMYSAITSGIGTLKGPLHGGANEAALKMFMRVGDPSKAEEFVDEALRRKEKIMGFGHRIYKSLDPRYRVTKPIAAELAKQRGKMSLYETAVRVEDAAIKALAASKLFPNVDYYSGIVFSNLSIDPDLFTNIFTIARISGWAAHTLEYLEDNRLIRPKAYYTGTLDLKYVPIERRS